MLHHSLKLDELGGILLVIPDDHKSVIVLDVTVICGAQRNASRTVLWSSAVYLAITTMATS